MSETNMEIATMYDPKSVESRLYDWWLKSGFFKADEDAKKPKYSIVIPPPNVTGVLHMGHALDFTLQDVLSRFKRMKGYSVLWLPGMDHAGIATQARVESTLREQGISRYDLGREKFLEKVWEWKDQYASVIRSQWTTLGFSLDFSRERFTMDEGLSKAVRKVFVDLYKKGLIYRGNRIINWDPAARTALSDIEVEYKELTGALYHMRYELEDGSGFITVATTRPETMLGDTAVAVHPEDKRYQQLIGKKVKLPITGRLIPIIADDYVDPEFGSGAVKITPAHDPNDFEVGVRHSLEMITVMDETAKMNEAAGAYAGLDRFECRKKLTADLQEQGVLFKIEEHVHQVGHSERSGAVVEPFLSTQWFVKMGPLAEQAIELQRSDDAVRFVPDRFEKIYLHWIENIRDWCISRQLWWGHRIPAWYCENCGDTQVEMEDPTACASCGSAQLKQDDDVLDTWFSSALWPFSTMGWPEETQDLERYYPTDVLVTGYDIIYFWVARMIFTALEFTGQKPFQDVLIHGLIRDSEGRKMSKSLGNGVDPIEVVEQFGADALRFMLMTGTAPGNDLRFYMDKVEAARNFANKIWNAARFVMMNLTEEDQKQPVKELVLGELKAADRWILTRLTETAGEINRRIESYDFGGAGAALYEFIWNEYCDWYIELSKPYLYGADERQKAQTASVLVYVLDAMLRLLHPFMPFVTEELWKHLPGRQGNDTIMLSAYPEYESELVDEVSSLKMNVLIEAIRAVRAIRVEAGAPPSRKIQLLIKPQSADYEEIFREGELMLTRLLNPESIEIRLDAAAPEKAMTSMIRGAEIYVPLEGLIDLEAEIQRLEKELAKLDSEVERVEKKLSNPGFVSKAPADVIETERAKGEEYKQKRELVKRRIAELKA